jgi:dTDP-glucose 4,6-dehydratase
MPLPASDLEHVLAHTRDAWRALAGGRLFITGGTGFFGKWLLETFVHANAALGLGAQAVVLSRDPQAFARTMPHLADAACLRFARGAIGDFAPPEGSFSHVIHAATPTSAALHELSPFEMIDTGVNGTRRVLDFAIDKKVMAFLFTSSGAVYGATRSGEAGGARTAFAESTSSGPDLSNPRNAYAETKRLAEVMCAVAAEKHGLPVRIARCFAFVGPYLPLDQHFAIGNFIGNALRGENIHIKGDGLAVRSYLYAADLAIALWQLLLQGDSRQAYNIGSPEAISIGDLARAVANAVAPQLRVEIAGAAVPGLDYYVPDTARFDARFGTQRRIGLPEAIGRTRDFYRQRDAGSALRFLE